jgi:hypothetical protein
VSPPSTPEYHQTPGSVGAQSETYRKMRVETGDAWEGHHAGTNSLWLHYLADKMLTSKGVPCSAAEKRALTGFRRRALKAASAAALVWDSFFEGAWTAGTSHVRPAC